MRARELLWDVAVDQYGYVTLRDAGKLGINGYAIRMLLARGQLERVGHGVYHFPKFPVTSRDPYMLAVLWTGVSGTCLSHDTALAVREVCDINPDRIHLTVPKDRRIRRAGGDLYVVHYQDVTLGQVEWWEQIPIVSLPVAISQCIASGVPTYLLRQAIENGRRLGSLTVTEAEDLKVTLEGRHEQQ